MAGTTFQELLAGVAQYYGAGSDQWVQIARYGVTAETIPIIEQVPGVSITRSNSGVFLGYDYTNPFASVVNPASTIDSNLQTGAYGSGAFSAQLPATAVTDQSTGITTMESGARAVSAGATIATIADKASLALVGVSLGTKLGKLIDSALYSINPDWWDVHYPAINPETWDDMATTQGGKNFIRAVFGLQGEDATMYLDERLLAYTYMMLLQNGGYTVIERVTSVPTNFPRNMSRYLPISIGPVSYRYEHPDYIETGVFTATAGKVVCIGTTSKIRVIAIFDRAPTTQLTVRIGRRGTRVDRQTGAVTEVYPNFATILDPRESGYTFNNKIALYKASTFYILSGETVSITNSVSSIISDDDQYIAWVALYSYESTIGLDGVDDNPQAGENISPESLINPTTGQPVTANDDPADVLRALKNLHPDLFDDAIYEDVPQPDGTIQRITYIPTPYPDTTNQQQPVTDTTPGINPQTDPQINPDVRTEDVLNQLSDTLTGDPTTPDTGDGNTPSAVIPTGSASALYSIYNPSQSELNSFGAWLWSSNFVDQLLKLFNDPMQAIIGLHKVFAQPTISGTNTIKVGYLDSGVSSNVVGNQYATIDCGSVNVAEYFGNVFDYDPFTQIYIYLPFVGIEKLDTGDVMRGSIGVKYHVDVLTGACLAEITVTRDGAGGILYTFAGNCAVQYPVSSGSYMGIVASLASIAGGVVGTVASGGMLAPLAMGAVSGVMNAHTRVSHSGAFSGNAGAMGVKKPYLIITRPQTCLADNFPAFDGFPANKTTTIAECSGYVKCKTCHVENVPATDAELTEIEMLLKGGIII